jgi:predicted signal transduction protein with EAL and GGDEF domain
LVKTAERIGHGLRGSDTLARLGGDEFVILLLGLQSEQDCQASLERLLQAIEQPIVVDGMPLRVTASIGVTLYPQDDHDPDALLRHADQAMYQAKQSGKNRYHIFDSQQDSRIRVNRELCKRIKQGLAAQEFELFYQPKVIMADHSIMGAEALIRWRHPERGLLAPMEFLPIIENSELEFQVGDWVIDTALQQLDAWRSQALVLEVSINIAAAHLQSPRFIETLRSKLSDYPRIRPQQLQIEILETAALADIDRVNEIIEACAALGVGFALDDFGTGYSSLAYLRKLPVETLKIDQSFIRDMLADSGDYVIVQGIIALAKAFNHATVAEGVETQAHFQALLAMGCQIGQGYGIARPMPAEALSRWASKARCEH